MGGGGGKWETLIFGIWFSGMLMALLSRGQEDNTQADKELLFIEMGGCGKSQTR